jgi:hypothetical protein
VGLVKRSTWLWLTIVVPVIAIANTYEPPGSWNGFVYTDRNNLLTDIKIGAFATS